LKGELRHSLRHRYQEILSREIRRIPLGDGTDLRIVLLFPSEYRIGMANLGFQLIYAAFNSIRGVQCHRAFLPSPSDICIAERESLRSIETFEPINAYDIVAFSLSYENDLPNVLKMLRLGRIPVMQVERNSSNPLVIAGGIVATLNPEPIAQALDAVVLGEGEATCRLLARAAIEAWSGRRNRDDVLRRFSHLPGVYVPSMYRAIYNQRGMFAGLYPESGAPDRLTRGVIGNLDDWPGSRVIHSPDIEFSDLHIVEVSRGCSNHCHFCIIPNGYSCYRYRSAASVIEEASQGPGHLRIGLMGAGTADHPDLHSICSSLRAAGRAFSFSSLHASEIGGTFIDLVRLTGPRTLTIAPEAGSWRRRKKLGKRVTDEEVFEAARIAARTDIAYLKMYFMIGLPGETVSDIEEIAVFCTSVLHEIHSIQKGTRHSLRLCVSVSCFVPKPHTAFERAVMRSEHDYRDRMTYLVTAMRKIRHIRLTLDNPKSAFIQGLIARGDRRLITTLDMIASGEQNWRQVLRSEREIVERHAFTRHGRLDPLPWDHLRVDPERA